MFPLRKPSVMCRMHFAVLVIWPIVFACAQGQVEKAEAREVRLANDSTAAAWCIETSFGADIKGCANRQIVTTPGDRLPVMAASRY